MSTAARDAAFEPELVDLVEAQIEGDIVGRMIEMSDHLG